MTRDIASVLARENRFLVVTHVNPDGDALGSLLGMSLALSEMGKQSWALLGEDLPDRYEFLPGRESLISSVRSSVHKPDWIICVDAATRERISGDLAAVSDNARMINIDHHPTNPGFGDLNLIVPEATSAAELVYQVLVEAGYRLSSRVGKCLYTGLVTDTGCFRFPGVDSKTFQFASELLASGFESYDVTRVLFEEHPLSKFKLEQLMLERMEMFLDDRLVISTLYAADLQRVGARMPETENLVNRLRAIRGVEAAAMITEVNGHLTKGSLRSKGSLDVSAVAATLGGGGHRRAAGLRSTLTPEALKEKIIEVVSERLSDR
jgi:bifunctional oligoribonuclease and PAP phosphatase NrnA